MENQTDQLFDYDVMTGDGNKIGKVDGVWVDDASNDLEFVAVKTGWLMGKNHIIPTANAQIDSANQTITVPYDGDQVKHAPSFSSDAELSPSDEDQIYNYYGMGRETATSPTGEAATGGYTGQDMNAGTDQYAGAGTGNFSGSDTGDDIEVPLAEEELTVGKRQVQTGDVRLRKVVRTEHVSEPVTLQREEVEIERVPASDLDSVPDDAFQERTIDVPLTEEQPVVSKETHVVGGVRVNREMTTEQRTVEGDVRTEDVEVDGDTDQVDGSYTGSASNSSYNGSSDNG